MFYEIDVGKYGHKYIKKGREKCQVVIINAFHSHQNLSSLSNFNQQEEAHWGTSVFDYIFSKKKKKPKKNSKQKKEESTGNGMGRLSPTSRKSRLLQAKIIFC